MLKGTARLALVFGLLFAVGLALGGCGGRVGVTMTRRSRPAGPRPVPRPFETAAGMWAARESLLVELRSEEGGRGMGEAPIDPSTRRRSCSAASASCSRGGEGVPEDVRHASGSGLGGAVLDLAAPPEPVAARCGPGSASTRRSRWRDRRDGRRGRGRGRGRLPDAQAQGRRAEREPRTLVDRVRAVRQAVGPDVALRLDVNGAWELGRATARLRPLEVDLEYVEQPLAGDDTAARPRSGGGRRADRGRRGRHLAGGGARARRAGAGDVLVVKPARVGGPVAAPRSPSPPRRGVPVVVSSLFETGFGLAAALAWRPRSPTWRDGRPRNGTTGWRRPACSSTTCCSSRS